MRVAPEIVLTNEEHAELAKLARSKRTSARLVQRARIVLLAALVASCQAVSTPVAAKGGKAGARPKAAADLERLSRAVWAVSSRMASVTRL